MGGHRSPGLQFAPMDMLEKELLTAAIKSHLSDSGGPNSQIICGHGLKKGAADVDDSSRKATSVNSVIGTGSDVFSSSSSIQQPRAYASPASAIQSGARKVGLLLASKPCR
jgi:hypothetical protein